MRKSLKRMAALGLAIVMSSATLMACGQGESGKKDNKTVISVGIWDEKQRPAMEQLIVAYQEKKPDITVEIQLTRYKGGEYWTKLEASATGGTAPDVFWLNVLHAKSYQEGGILLDLTEYEAKSDLDIHNNFPKSLVEMYTIDDKLYAIPKDFDTNALWYNKEIFDKAGVDYPTDDWTFDDIVTAAKALKAGGLDEGTYPFVSPLDFQTCYYQTVYANDGWILNEDKTESGYGDPKTQEGIQWWIDMIEEGLAPSLADITDTPADTMFGAGNLAMIFAGSYMTPEYLANDTINQQIDLVEVPKFNNVEANIINGLGYAVYSGTKNEAAAVDFALWLGSEAAMKIQGEAGTVISARNDAQHYFADANKNLNLAAYTNHSDIAYPLPVGQSAAEFYDLEDKNLKLAFAGEKSLADVCKELKIGADALLNK